MTVLHTDYYEILGVSPNCSREEIKRAFRRKAKELHPDVSTSGGSTIGQMQLVLKAYETLGNPAKREEYDRLHAVRRSKDDFDYRAFLRERTDDPESQSKLIFFDLLHKHEDDAVKLYDYLCTTEEGFRLAENLDREDFMDCAFLLAEEYDCRGDYLKSFHLLTTLVTYERERPYFRHFFTEVTERLRALTCVRMPGKVSDEKIISCLEQLVTLGLSRKDTAYFLKKIAEYHTRNERHELAAFYLKKGMELDRKLAGAKKLKQQIGLADA
ncbi:J domain-containing protein [Salinispira pacifica]